MKRGLQRYISTDHLAHELGRRTAAASAVTLASQVVKFVLNFVAIATLGRLLRPQDYGLFGICTVLTGFAALFLDLGLNQATVQRDDIDEAQVTATFWLGLAVSIATALVTVALGPLLAIVYADDRVGPMTTALALCLVLSGLAAQHVALLRRQMSFATLARIEIAAVAAGVAVAIAAGAVLRSAWALVAQQLVQAAATTTGAWLACRWVPSRPSTGVNIAAHVRFGAQVSGFRIVNYFARSADNALIGWAHGAAQLGYYTRAYSVLLFPLSNINAPIGAALIPALSRLQGDPTRFSELYLAALRVLAWLTLPLSGFVLGAAKPLMLLLLGPGWEPVAPILQVLALSAVGQVTLNTLGWLYTARGQGARMFRWGIFASAWIVGSFVVGLPWGPIGVATAYSVAVLALCPLGVRYAFRETRLSGMRLVRAIAMPALALVGVGGVSFYVVQVAVRNQPATIAVIAAALPAALVTAALFVLSGSVRHARALWNSLRRGNQA